MAATKRFTGIPATRGSSPGTSSAAVSGNSKARKNEPQDGTGISIARKRCVLSSDVRRRRSQRPITLSPGEAMSRTAVWKRSGRLAADAVQRCLDAGAHVGPADRDSFFVAIQLWAWLYGLVDLCISKPEMPWPAVDTLLDAMLSDRGLSVCGALTGAWERLDHDQARTAWPQLVCLLKG